MNCDRVISDFRLSLFVFRWSLVESRMSLFEFYKKKEGNEKERFMIRLSLDFKL